MWSYSFKITIVYAFTTEWVDSINNIAVEYFVPKISMSGKWLGLEYFHKTGNHYLLT